MYVKVKVRAGAKKELFEKRAGKAGDVFEVHVKAPAERNLANKAVMTRLAEYFKVPVGKVRIISGHHSGSKIFSVDI